MRMIRAVAFLALLLVSSTAHAAKRPNIIVILADDLGFSDIGSYGSEIQTPHLDDLAARGTRFRNFYNTARCCPTRASLLTGQYAHRVGIGHMVEDLGTPAYRGDLSPRSVTIAEALKGAGYRTYVAGKWHVARAAASKHNWPLQRGFDGFYGILKGGSYFSPDLVQDNERVKPEGDNYYFTDALTDHALSFLKSNDAERPFFLYLAFTAPHFPLHARAEDIARIRGRYRGGWEALRQARHRRQIELGVIDTSVAVGPNDLPVRPWSEVSDKDEWDLRMSVYAAQVERMDWNIGRVLAHLRAQGAEQNTLIFFLSDNGGTGEELNRGEPGASAGSPQSFMSYGIPWASASNTPFRLFKRWTHEGGIATPFIATWPGRIPAGRFSDQVGHVIDLLPTCLQAANTRYPRKRLGSPIPPADGQSLLPAMEGSKTLRPRTLFWEHEGRRAVRKGDWKLVSQFDGDWELYDLRLDRTETRDLASHEPTKVRALAREYERWARSVGVLPWAQIKTRALRPAGAKPEASQ